MSSEEIAANKAAKKIQEIINANPKVDFFCVIGCPVPGSNSFFSNHILSGKKYNLVQAIAAGIASEEKVRMLIYESVLEEKETNVLKVINAL